MPTCMRDWISARNVWLSTVGSPPRVRSRSLRSPLLPGGTLDASNATSGLMQMTKSAPSSSSSDAFIVRISAPST